MQLPWVAGRPLLGRRSVGLLGPIIELEPGTDVLHDRGSNALDLPQIVGRLERRLPSGLNPDALAVRHNRPGPGRTDLRQPP